MLLASEVQRERQDRWHLRRAAYRHDEMKMLLASNVQRERQECWHLRRAAYRHVLLLRCPPMESRCQRLCALQYTFWPIRARESAALRNSRMLAKGTSLAATPEWASRMVETNRVCQLGMRKRGLEHWDFQRVGGDTCGCRRKPLLHVA